MRRQRCRSALDQGKMLAGAGFQFGASRRQGGERVAGIGTRWEETGGRWVGLGVSGCLVLGAAGGQSGVVLARPGTEGGVESKCLRVPLEEQL